MLHTMKVEKVLEGILRVVYLDELLGYLVPGMIRTERVTRDQ